MHTDPIKSMWPGRRQLPVEELSNVELFHIGRAKNHPRKEEAIKALVTRWARQRKRNQNRAATRVRKLK